MSERTNVVSMRPWGKPLGPPKLSPTPCTVICGSTTAVVMPFLIPKSAGFKATFGAKVMWMRLKPKRASFTRLEPKMCV